MFLIRDAGGKPRSVLVIGRDITELREAQHELEQYRQHMSQTERLVSLGTLSATVAHELAQPLTVVRLSIQEALAGLSSSACSALIENAIQAADGRIDRKLVISGHVEGQQIVLRFADTCGGIAPENLGKIFVPFFTTKPLGEGTGLGLCIVEAIVSRLTGKVHVETTAGEGSTFCVILPVAGQIG